MDITDPVWQTGSRDEEKFRNQGLLFLRFVCFETAACQRPLFFLPSHPRGGGGIRVVVLENPLENKIECSTFDTLVSAVLSIGCLGRAPRGPRSIGFRKCPDKLDPGYEFGSSIAKRASRSFAPRAQNELKPSLT
ncbi:hypothetical protein TNCV_5012401 [Trichonephila clavipes]|nr:hypothetical protein TNCV_5012401 [Trichonephila clavipes]